MRPYRSLVLLLAVLLSACGGAVPSAPSAVVVSAPPAAPVIPSALAEAGQSNALFILPFLTAAYAPGHVVGFAQDGSTIRQWGVAAPEGYWVRLAPSLHQPLRAFVWWQGESDRDDVAEYPAALDEFLARVRTEAGDPRLLIALCRVIDNPAFSGIRAGQQDWVASHARAVLVSSDGLPLEAPDSAHLSADGYVAMSQRILAAVVAQEARP